MRPLKGSWSSFLGTHADLRRRIERLRSVADTVGQVPRAALRAEVDGVYRFLSHDLLGHMSVEETILHRAMVEAPELRGAAAT